MNTKPGRIRFFGCPLDLISPTELRERVADALAGGERLRVEGINVAKLIDVRQQPPLKQALEEAELVHVDGAGVALGLAWLNIDAPPRRAGVDLMQDLCADAARLNAGIFLLGATRGVVEAAAARLQADLPGLRIAGLRDGYFSEAEELRIVDEIRTSGARLLFIGISSPKKELFLQRHWHALGVGVAMGVGGTFDVLSGKLPRAPLFMQRYGMEWLFRLAVEPRRLLWRYLRTNTRYLALLLRARLGGAGHDQ